MFGDRAAELADRFRSKVDSSSGPDGCWPWTGARSLKGYGQWHPFAGVHVPAHRFALILKLRRDLGPTEVARHACHNPPCCNPAHLSTGSQSDNMLDSVRDRRAYVGELNAMARFTDEQILDLRRRAATDYRRGWFEVEAQRFGTKASVVARAVRGELWAHLPGAVAVGNEHRGYKLGTGFCVRGHDRQGRRYCRPCAAAAMRACRDRKKAAQDQAATPATVSP